MEWNKNINITKTSGLTHQSHPNRLVTGPQSPQCELLDQTARTQGTRRTRR